MAARPPTDLTAAHGLGSLSGTPVVELAEATLRAGRQILATWDQLKPIVEKLIDTVRVRVDAGGLEPDEATKLLGLSATVVQKLGVTGQGMLRGTEGMAKLQLLLSAGREQRRAPGEMTEKQLVAIVVETVKRLREQGKPCPACGASAPIEVTHGSA